MRILFVHNAYQHRGGEDSVVDTEIALLRSRGHAVETYFRSNDDVGGMPSLALVRQTLWSDRTPWDMAEIIRRFQPDVIHAHNTFPLISPSLYWAAERARVPMVQTLHNFRLLCPQAMLLRDGHVCEDCVGHIPWRGVVRACYRGSVAQSSAVAGLLALHRSLGTFQNKVTRYIALNDFCRDVFVRGGLPADRICVKPNFVDVPPPSSSLRARFLFVGRLLAEKGVRTLTEAMGLLRGTECEMIGAGPEEEVLRNTPGVHMTGWQESGYIVGRMQAACALVLPSLWYENFPRTLVDAFACGLPVIASRLGAMAALIQDGETGMLFEPGNARDLADKMAWALAHLDAMGDIGEKARHEYESKYTPQRNLEILLAIYREAIAAAAPS